MNQIRRRFLLSVIAVTVPGRLFGQTASATPRIAVYVPGSRETHGSFVGAFQQGMREFGYAEGRNVVYDLRWAEGRVEKAPELIRDILQQKPNVIVTMGSPIAQAAKSATSTVPIVMASAGDPVGQGLVASLSRPGGNITGISLMVESTIAKEIEMLREVIPNANRIAVLVNPKNPFYQTVLPELESTATKLHVQLLRTDITNLESLDSALSAVAAQHPEALIVTSDGLFQANRKKLVEFAARHRIPATYPQSEFVIDGGLMSYVPSVTWRFHRAAYYVHRILKGAKPGELPVEQPTNVELFVNRKTARTLGITIPQSVLVRADRVIE